MIGGFLLGLIVTLLFKGNGEIELPTIFDEARQTEVQKKADQEIEIATEKIETAKKKTHVNHEKRKKVFDNGLTDAEYDSIARAIHIKRRKADSIRNAEEL